MPHTVTPTNTGISRALVAQSLGRQGNNVVTSSFCIQPAHAPYGDANKHWILEHIKQLHPVFHEFEGIITTVQAGFIGNWGKHFKLELGGIWYISLSVSCQYRKEGRKCFI